MSLNSPYADIARVDQKEAEDVLQYATFHNTPFNGEQLSHEHIVANDLIPRYKVPVQEGFAYLSDLFYLIDKRVAVLGYIQPKNQPTVIRSYYRSKSQGVLRYLADYMMKDNVFDWYAKGHEHAHITACIAMQKAFAQIEQDDIPRYVDHHELLFAGTARERKPGEPPYRGTSGEPEPLAGNFYPKTENRIQPEKLTFNNPEEVPDFSRVIDSWKKSPETYGEVTVHIVPSKNDIYHYMFCRDSRKRAWIGMVERKTGTFMSTGIFRPWIIAGDLITPAYEYPALAHGYGNSSDQHGPYVDMYTHFLAHVPVIQDYLKTVKV